MNLYGYVGGDPINWIDPEGLAPDGFGLFGSYFFGKKPFKAISLPTLPNTIPTPGDMISDPKGNVWGEPQDQDNVCSLPGLIGTIADECVLDRCQRHDVCYEENACTASSWLANALGGTKACNQCNNEFFE